MYYYLVFYLLDHYQLTKDTQPSGAFYFLIIDQSWYNNILLLWLYYRSPLPATAVVGGGGGRGLRSESAVRRQSEWESDEGWVQAMNTRCFFSSCGKKLLILSAHHGPVLHRCVDIMILDEMTFFYCWVLTPSQLHSV